VRQKGSGAGRPSVLVLKRRITLVASVVLENQQKKDAGGGLEKVGGTQKGRGRTRTKKVVRTQTKTSWMRKKANDASRA